jgi:hypothetical protein
MFEVISLSNGTRCARFFTGTGKSSAVQIINVKSSLAACIRRGMNEMIRAWLAVLKQEQVL